MKTKIMFVMFWAVSSLITVSTQTPPPPVYYKYDNCGNRYLRSIIMPSKAALVKDTTSSKNVVQDNKNTQPEKYKDKILQKDVLIYPNPTKGLITVEVIGYDSKDGAFQIVIYDLTGHKLQTGHLNHNTGEINISGFKPGEYIMRISIGSDMKQWNIIKQ